MKQFLMRIQQKLESNFYITPNIITYLLLPFSYLFRGLVFMRHLLYGADLFKVTSFSRPVVVIGNITVGGTGKTPLIIWLTNYLKAKGYKVGVVSHGYGVKTIKIPQFVDEETAVACGDEPYLIYRHTQVPVVVSSDRVAAVQLLLQQKGVDVVLSDDGLQHYSMDRTLEVAVVDGTRLFGNRLCLPAGPLREPVSRLNYVQYVVLNLPQVAQFSMCREQLMRDIELRSEQVFGMQLMPGKLVSVADFNEQKAITDLQEKKVHAVSGIGNPKRFFDLLEQLGVQIVPHVFPDHHLFTLEDIDFGDTSFVIMTEKDAVKCRSFADQRHWFLPVQAEVSQSFGDAIIDFLSM
ncbi:MAG: tetraacyldisaccharide 4'-kinase [Pseudomonadota bacterium]|nr:tetraacyldisaccharide 4'-kinase [Gammaproteobacteria bacterium]MBU2545900.1 tetraacyldisaccharide 4'-kinase [Gammaproteobacteria bacterium]